MTKRDKSNITINPAKARSQAANLRAWRRVVVRAHETQYRLCQNCLNLEARP